MMHIDSNADNEIYQPGSVMGML